MDMPFNPNRTSSTPIVLAASSRPDPKPEPDPVQVLETFGRDVASFTKEARRHVASTAGDAERTVLSPYLKYAANMGAERFVHPTRHADGAAPDQYGIPFETLHFNSDDGKIPLAGWYMPAGQPTDKTVILSHGVSGQQGEMVKQYASWLHEAGYNVLSFDYRNSGNSGGDHTTIGYDERNDLKAAVDLATKKGANKIAVLGVSMGGATAIEEAVDDQRINAIVDDCAFDTLYDAVKPRFENNVQDVGPFKVHDPFPSLASEAIVQKVEQDTGEPLTSTDPLKEITKLGDRPMLFIHGANDNETLPQDSVNLYNADPSKDKQLWIVPGAAHAQSYNTDPKEYQQKVLDFLKASIG